MAFGAAGRLSAGNRCANVRERHRRAGPQLPSGDEDRVALRLGPEKLPAQAIKFPVAHRLQSLQRREPMCRQRLALLRS